MATDISCLATGLIWSLFIRDADLQCKVSTVFLLVASAAGILGN